MIYDISGAMVATLPGSEVAYDLSHLSAGTYMIKVTTEDQNSKAFKVNKL